MPMALFIKRCLGPHIYIRLHSMAEWIPNGPGFFCGPWPKMKRLPRWGPARPAASFSRPLASIPTQVLGRGFISSDVATLSTTLWEMFEYVQKLPFKRLSSVVGTDGQRFYIYTTSFENREPGSARCIASISDDPKCIPWSVSLEGSLELWGKSSRSVASRNAQKKQQKTVKNTSSLCMASEPTRSS